MEKTDVAPLNTAYVVETPPRTWRRRGDALRSETRVRNTSTDVEKTSKVAPMGRPSRKHLHGRGEDQTIRTRWFGASETPPRTWRRLWKSPANAQWLGNTSTDVEKTPFISFYFLSFWKHLHGRGEDLSLRGGQAPDFETPPRTWRRLWTKIKDGAASRNTSTDVEKTIQQSTKLLLSRKHLHGRGEDACTSPTRRWLKETPPRTWRRRDHYVLEVFSFGNTSTDVEKTIDSETGEE